jgi:hypothetical protein
MTSSHVTHQRSRLRRAASRRCATKGTSTRIKTHPGSRISRGLRLLVAVVGLSILTLTLAATPAHAALVCQGDGGQCVIVPDTAQTPLGLVTVTVSTSNVVTVFLDPSSPRTVVFGLPFGYPPGPPVIPGYARTSITTDAGVINIDTIQSPPGPPTRFSLPNVAVISIYPPGPPVRAHTSGTTVTFTPISPPGPPT